MWLLGDQVGYIYIYIYMDIEVTGHNFIEFTGFMAVRGAGVQGRLIKLVETEEPESYTLNPNLSSPYCGP